MQRTSGIGGCCAEVVGVKLDLPEHEVCGGVGVNLVGEVGLVARVGDVVVLPVEPGQRGVGVFEPPPVLVCLRPMIETDGYKKWRR